MVRYKSKIRKGNLEKYARKNPYSIRDLYKLLNLYNKHLRKKNPYRTKMRRGYKSKLNSPSRIRHYSSQSSSYRPRTVRHPRIHYQPQPPYRPKNQHATARGKSQPLYRPTRYPPPRIRTEPDIEEMLKQLEKRFDEKLEERVLEAFEAEQRKLEEAVKKETELQEPSTEATEPDSNEIAEGLTSEDELNEAEERFEWLREEIGEGQKEEPADIVEPTVEPMASLESNEPPTLGIIEPPEDSSLELPVDIESDQLADFEPLLDQIEPLEPSLLEPIELGLEPMSEILLEPLVDEEIQEPVEAEVY